MAVEVGNSEFEISRPRLLIIDGQEGCTQCEDTPGRIHKHGDTNEPSIECPCQERWSKGELPREFR